MKKKFNITVIYFLIFLFQICCQVHNSDETYQKTIEERSEIFSYDDKLPLNITVRREEHKENLIIYDILYDSSGGSVTAFLVVPVNIYEPCPGIVYMHWGLGNRYEFLIEAELMAQKQVISILIDSPMTRGSNKGFSADYEDDPPTRIAIQTVIDLRRAIDLLLKRSDIDKDRIAFVGHSFGANWGGVLSGIEKRIKGYILMAGLPQPSKTNDTSEEIDPIHFIPYATPAELLFQFATDDDYIPREDAYLYFNTASEPKTIMWYKAGHKLNDAAEEDRAEWLSRLFKTIKN